MSIKEINDAKKMYDKLIELGLNEEEALLKSFENIKENPIGLFIFMGMYNFKDMNFKDEFAPDNEFSDYALMINLETFEEVKVKVADLPEFLNNFAVIYPDINNYAEEEFSKAFHMVRCEYLNLLLNETVNETLNVLDKKYAGRRIFS